MLPLCSLLQTVQGPPLMVIAQRFHVLSDFIYPLLHLPTR